MCSYIHQLRLKTSHTNHVPLHAAKVPQKDDLETESITLFSAACGRPSPVKVGSSTAPQRIVGGVNSVDGDWPWQVSLHFAGNLYCGASVLTSNWLISAAHCFSKERSVTLMINWIFLDAIYSVCEAYSKLSGSVHKSVCTCNISPQVIPCWEPFH